MAALYISDHNAQGGGAHRNAWPSGSSSPRVCLKEFIALAGLPADEFAAEGADDFRQKDSLPMHEFLSALCRLSTFNPEFADSLAQKILNPSYNIQRAGPFVPIEIIDWAVLQSSIGLGISLSNDAEEFIKKIHPQDYKDIYQIYWKAKRTLDFKGEVEKSTCSRIDWGKMPIGEQISTEMSNVRLFRYLQNEGFHRIDRKTLKPYARNSKSLNSSSFVISYWTTPSSKVAESHKNHFEDISQNEIPIDKLHKQPQFRRNQQDGALIERVHQNLYSDAPGYMLLGNIDGPIAIISFYIDHGNVLCIKQLQGINYVGFAGARIIKDEPMELANFNWRKLLVLEGVLDVCKQLEIDRIAINPDAPRVWARTVGIQGKITDVNAISESMTEVARSLGMVQDSSLGFYVNKTEALRKLRSDLR